LALMPFGDGGFCFSRLAPAVADHPQHGGGEQDQEGYEGDGDYGCTCKLMLFST
jgi:hypothetical protein